MLAQGIDQFKQRGPRMEPDDLLCSRNARSGTPLVGRAQWKINQAPSLRGNERAWREHLYPSTRAVGDNPDHLLKVVGAKCKSKLNELFDRQRLCTASRVNIKSLQCLVKRMRFVALVSQGIDERFSPMREGRLYKRAKPGFFLLVESRALFRAQQNYRRADFRPRTKALGRDTEGFCNHSGVLRHD